MSKKVLNYAGKRPMLLALIMASLTFGLLFSGWLTPTPGRAQQGDQNPSASQEKTNCVEKGPYYGAWSLDSCPSQTNSPSVTPTSFCNKVGDAPTMPTVTPPAYSAGQKEQPITYDCPCPSGQTCPSVNYAGISYTVGSVQWDPPLPGTFGTANLPSFSSTAYVNVTSSDSGLCADPGRVNIGSCTWSIVKGYVVLTGSTFNWIPDWAANFANVAGGYISLPTTISSVSSQDNNYYHSYCCSNNPSSVSYDEQIVNAGTQTFQCSAGTTSIQALADTMINNTLDTLGVTAPGLASAITSWCDANGSFSLASISAAGSASFKNVNGYNDTCHCGGSSSAWFGTDEVSCNGTVGVLTVPASVSQSFGQNFSVNITALSASLDYKIHGQTLYAGPNTTDFSNTISTRRKSDIHSYIQIGSYENTIHLSGPTDTTTTTQTTICEGNEFPG